MDPCSDKLKREADVQQAYMQGIADACKVNCHMCASGLLLRKSSEGFWSHPERGVSPEGRTCHSDKIWKLFHM